MGRPLDLSPLECCPESVPEVKTRKEVAKIWQEDCADLCECRHPDCLYTWMFPKMSGTPKKNMGSNTKIAKMVELWMIWGTPIVGNPHLRRFHRFFSGFPSTTITNKARTLLTTHHPTHDQHHGSLNVPIEHHPTIRYMVYKCLFSGYFW